MSDEDLLVEELLDQIASERLKYHIDGMALYAMDIDFNNSDLNYNN